jgi:hypothetical protein
MNRNLFRVKQTKGFITILRAQFFLSEARQLSSPVCLFLATLIDSKLYTKGYVVSSTPFHWRDGLEAMRKYGV